MRLGIRTINPRPTPKTVVISARATAAAVYNSIVRNMREEKRVTAIFFYVHRDTTLRQWSTPSIFCENVLHSRHYPNSQIYDKFKFITDRLRAYYKILVKQILQNGPLCDLRGTISLGHRRKQTHSCVSFLKIMHQEFMKVKCIQVIFVIHGSLAIISTFLYISKSTIL